MRRKRVYVASDFVVPFCVGCHRISNWQIIPVGSYGTRMMVILIGSKLTVFDDGDDDIDDGSYDPPDLKTLFELRHVRHYADSAIPDSLTKTVAVSFVMWQLVMWQPAIGTAIATTVATVTTAAYALLDA